MAPAHANDSPGDGAQEHGSADSATVPIPLPRLRRAPRLHTLHRTVRRCRPARPSTVWPCAQDAFGEGVGLLANWLLTAVVKIVTTYTQPGQRVLLLDPAPYLTPPAPPSTTGSHNQARRGPYIGLHEAGWTVVRLGRGVQTQAAVAQPDAVSEHPSEHPGDVSTESGSGPRPHTGGPISDHSTGRSAHHRREPDPAASGSSPDRFDLIITAAEPSTAHWFHPANWAGLLTPIGTLAVITRGDYSRGRLADPAGALVRAAHHAGLRYLDRIALLRVPIRDGALTAATSARHLRSQAPARPLSTPARHAPVHDDLLVFTRQDPVDAEETSDE